MLWAFIHHALTGWQPQTSGAVDVEPSALSRRRERGGYARAKEKDDAWGLAWGGLAKRRTG